MSPRSVCTVQDSIRTMLGFQLRRRPMSRTPVARALPPPRRRSQPSIGIDGRSLHERADPSAVLINQEDRRAMARTAFGRVVGPERADLEAGQVRRRARLKRKGVLAIRGMCNDSRKYLRFGRSCRDERLPYGLERRLMRDETGGFAFGDECHHVTYPILCNLCQSVAHMRHVSFEGFVLELAFIGKIRGRPWSQDTPPCPQGRIPGRCRSACSRQKVRWGPSRDG